MGICMGSPNTEEAKNSKKVDNYLVRHRREKKQQIKLLLLGKYQSKTSYSCSCNPVGPSEVGKSTILKQLKIYNLDGGYTPAKERHNYKRWVYQNCISDMKVLVQQAAELKIAYSTPEIAVWDIYSESQLTLRNRQLGWRKSPRTAFITQMALE